MSGGFGVFLAVVVLGFVAGVLSGMFGIGGGLVIVPALMILFQLPIKTATGTSLFALLWPVGVLGVVAYWKSGNLDAWLGTGIALGLFLGAYFGARITLALTPTDMKRLYAVFLLAAGAYYLWSTWPQPARGQDRPPAEGPAQVH
jgi:uncharacterized membrane protein YfcA